MYNSIRQLLKSILPSFVFKFLRRIKFYYKNIRFSRAKLEEQHWAKKKKLVGDLYLHQQNRLQEGIDLFSSLYRIPKYEKIADIGCGPTGGVLDILVADEKWAIEPIYSKYVESATWEVHSKVIIRETSGEILKNVPSKYFDAVFTINAIDHGDDTARCIKNISNILKVGGHFYLHVHCRKPHEINSLHRQVFSATEILEILKENNFIPEIHKVYKLDPLSGKYETLVGIFKKAS